MQFLKNRVLPVVCVLSILVSVCAVPAFAVWTDNDAFLDGDEVDVWTARLRSPANSSVYGEYMGWGASLSPVDIFWNYVDMAIGLDTGLVSLAKLNELCSGYRGFFDRDNADSFFKQLQQGTAEFLADCFGLAFLGVIPTFEIREHPSSGFLRMYCPEVDAWVVNSVGEYAYCNPNTTDDSVADHWIGEVTAADRATKEVAIHSLDRLNMMCLQLRDAGIPAQIKTLGTNYKCIWYNRQVYANADGVPYVSWVDENKAAVNQDRPTTNVTENGDIIEGDLTDNSTNIDLENMLITLPNGAINIIDQIIYDESTKSYHIDSHDTYNYTVNNYYTWNYYINYTSITYIGQTEEYNKYYEVYYELPDGRDSADLTKEELEQLNLSIDVIPYGRSADDTSLRSLYHFDGDTRDSSYWNYCTDFTWNKGASLTYMDSGVFDGALYLDETEHQFTMTLPSNIGSADFTLQFRYYQSATAAPVTDSSLKIGDGTIFQMDGAHFKTASGTAIAPISVGNWQEVCLMRSDGTLRLYHNGLPIFTYPVHANYTGPLGDTITFTFGSEQQTFKYFDEFRFINKAVYDAESYEPSSVPHDTNLTLVLPDTAVPVADEYWSFKNDSQTNILTQYGLDRFDNATNSTSKYFGSTGGNFDIYHSGIGYWVDCRNSGFQLSQDEYCFPYFTRYGTYTNQTFFDDGFYLDSSAYPTDLIFSHHSFYSASEAFPLLSSGVSVLPASGIFSLLALDDNQDIYNLPAGTYTFTLVTSSGSQESVTFTIPTSFSGSSSQDTTQMGKTEFTQSVVGGYEFGCMMAYADTLGNAAAYPAYWLFVRPESRTAATEGIVYMELVEGDSTALEAEKVSSVVPMDKADLHSPTLAVRTDIDITSYQIGGVRPSVPTKGQVWALVENERIVSIQIYNGQAWEGVDGRIWTGSRWVPASSYNIVTLQDMYDIVDATPDFEYIYTESGFWTWWQKSWNTFTEKLFSLLGTGGTGGGSGATGGSGSNGLKDVDLDEDITAADPEEEDGKSLWQFIVLVIDGGKSVVKGVRHLFSGVVSTIPDTMDGITGAFDSGGVAVGLMDGTGSDPDVSVETYSSAEGEVLDPWRYR